MRFYKVQTSIFVMDSNLQDMHVSVSRMDLCNAWLSHAKETRNNELFKLVSAKCDLSGATESSIRDIKVEISRFSSKILKKWESCSRCRQRFFESNNEWLRGEDLSFKVSMCPALPSTSSEATPGPGRPQTEFSKSCPKTKRRRIDDLVQTRSSNELLYAAEVSARLSDSANVARNIKQVVDSPNDRSKSTKKKTMCDSKCMNGEEALAYYIDNRLTVNTYKNSRKWSIKFGHNFFPSLSCVTKAKGECYTPEEQIVVDESRVEIKLQAILDKTAERLVLAENEVLDNLSPSCSSFKLISKWGCDGSSGHSRYKQKFIDTNATDEYLFAFSFVPLRLLDEEGNIVWQNPRPSSTMYCRPIKFIYSKETKDLTLSETNNTLEEIDALLPTICKVSGTEVSVKHEMLLTMIDGKVCNTLTETSSAQRCYVCGATPKDMNDLSKDFTPIKDKLCFGLSTLHARIRCFECLLHISYRLDVKKWQLRAESDKVNVKQRAEEIQRNFKTKMGLIVDKPKPGFGNTNDGNTARTFFENSELSAEITGLDVSLIKKIDTLLRALTSGYDINIEAFEKLAQETKTLYLNLYSWYYMPATVHKMLVHGVDIIRSAVLPIGQLSEEAQEARNKDLRRFRDRNAQKRSRHATNRDLINMLVITSDPLINSFRDVPKKKSGPLPPDVLALLIPPNVKNSNVDVVSSFHTVNSNDSSDDSSDNISDDSESSDDD